MLADGEGWSNDTGKTGKFTTVCIPRPNIYACKTDGYAVLLIASVSQPKPANYIDRAAGFTIL
jgi:hypothetical protein